MPLEAFFSFPSVFQSLISSSVPLFLPSPIAVNIDLWAGTEGTLPVLILSSSEREVSRKRLSLVTLF